MSFRSGHAEDDVLLAFILMVVDIASHQPMVSPLLSAIPKNQLLSFESVKNEGDFLKEGVTGGDVT